MKIIREKINSRIILSNHASFFPRIDFSFAEFRIKFTQKIKFKPNAAASVMIKLPFIYRKAILSMFKKATTQRQQDGVTQVTGIKI